MLVGNTQIQSCPRCLENDLSEADYCLSCNEFIDKQEVSELQIPLELVPMGNEIQKILESIFYIKQPKIS